MIAGRRHTRRVVVLLMVVFAGLQFTSPAHTNPESGASMTLDRIETVPADVARTLARACRDCHSNDTNWRWYTYVAPLSWWTLGHVNAGRAELNFSVWGTYGRRLRETRLRAMCGLTEKREMPPRSYALVHPEARVSDHDITQLCAWTALASSPNRTGGETR
jgi:heme-binding protein